MPGVASTPTFTPSPPTNLVANPSNGQISISFTPGNNKGFTITDYRYSLNGGAYSSAGTAVSPVIITGLTNGTSYSVTLKAVNSQGLGSASSSVSATPTAGIAWYSISISLQSEAGAIFNGYFSVDNDTNLVTAFYYENNFQENILGPIDTNTTYWDDGNYLFPNTLPYRFTAYGVNITKFPYYSNQGDTSQHYNLGLDSQVWLSSQYQDGSIPDPHYQSVIMNFAPISDPSCFNEGTKILILNKKIEEEYIPIENLRKGDLVKTYKHGYRKIDLIGKNPMINNPNRFDECMYKMEKTEENGLLDDLIVTGGHAILVHDLAEYKEENDKIFGITPMIDDKYLLLSAVSKEFIKLENTNLYTYYHFILENNGNDDERFGVWANGILTETPSKKQFNNHKYTLL